MFTKGSDYYTPRHYIKKFIWALVHFLLFRYSPRLLYGWRNTLLRLMGASIGKNVKIFPSVQITYPWNLHIEDGSIISWKVILYNLGPIHIGRNTIISQQAHICAGNHDYRNPRFTLLMPPITIGDGVWIAADAFIGPNILIGNEAVIGARAVITKNVEPKAVMVGNPAQFLKSRYTAKDIPAHG